MGYLPRRGGLFRSMAVMRPMAMPLTLDVDSCSPILTVDYEIKTIILKWTLYIDMYIEMYIDMYIEMYIKLMYIRYK